MASFTAAGTSYATWGQPMIPFFVFYSMFGFQRVGDLIWSFGDQRGRGFLLGATAGRTTLTGEGLQHCDGQSQMYALAYPNCRAYDPAFAYEVGVLVRDGIRRMYGAEPEDCYYYLTLYNENYVQPPMPEGVEEGIVRGMYLLRGADGEHAHRAQILASGPMVLQALEAQKLLAEQHDVGADVWSVPGGSSSATMPSTASAGTGCIPASRRARRTSPSSSPTRRDRSWRSPTGCERSPTPSPVSCPSPTSCSAPTATGSPTSAPRCAATSRSTPPTSPSRCSTVWPRPGDLKAETVTEAIERYDIDADAPDPRLA